MTDHDDIFDITEVMEDQMARGIARDLAIKILASLVSQMVGDQYGAIVQGHLQAIQTTDGNDDIAVTEKIASHFRDLMTEEDTDDD